MAILLRQFVACLLSASVLICGVYCGCNGHVAQSFAQAHTPKATEPQSSHCVSQHRDSHTHRAGDAQSDGRQSDSAPCHDGQSRHSDCQHCGTNAGVLTAGASDAGQWFGHPSAPALWAGPIASAFAPRVSLQASGLAAGAHPSRVGGGTLLGLRCALTL